MATKNQDKTECTYIKKATVLVFDQILQIIPSILTILSLSINAYNLKRILKSKFDDTSSFKGELRKINWTNLAFILSITY